MCVQDSLLNITMEKSFGHKNVAGEALKICEIIALIFSFLDTQSNARNALVCKAWSDPALDNVWRNVTRPFLLLGLLAPLQLRDVKDPECRFKSVFVRTLPACTVFQVF